MQNWVGGLMGMTESSMAAMAPKCFVKEGPNQPGGLCPKCQGRAVAVGCGFTVSVSVAVSAADAVVAAVTVVLNQVGCRLSLLLTRET